MYDNETIDELCMQYNNKYLPAAIIAKLTLEFNTVNGTENFNDVVFIPVLAPFQSHHKVILSKEEMLEEQQAYSKNQPEIVPKPIPEQISVKKEELPNPLKILKEKPIEEKTKEIEEPESEIVPSVIPKAIVAQPVKPYKEEGKLHYKLFPYTFSRPGETIEAVIRLYNDMNAGTPTLKKLVYEFSKNNTEAMPPRLGQTVQVPVLLPFVYRHVNNNKIFKD